MNIIPELAATKKHLEQPLMHVNNAVTYRPDIDGLRAVAILSVIGFHAFPAQISGGYIGVDIFFIISGYLISTIILKGLINGTLSFSDFYGRRIKRIFPALILVLTSSFAFAWSVFWPNELQQLGKHIMSSAGFVSNLTLWKEAGYFDQAAETKPLLHIWSLGIEEQFYLFWPLILWFGFSRKLNLLTITIALVIVSFYLNTKFVKSHPIDVFFLPITRFWELLLGGALAYLALFKAKILGEIAQKSDGILSRVYFSESKVSDGIVTRNTLSLLGVLALTYGLLQLNSSSPFPGKNALYPTLGALMIIAAGPTAWFNRIVLSHKSLVFLGLISYPLYLWHWPLLTFARISEGDAPAKEVRIMLILLAIILASLTYRFIEKPIRKSKRIATPILLTILMAIVAGMGYFAYSTLGVPGRLSANPNALSQRSNYLVLPETFDCTKEFSDVKYSFCRTSQEPTVAIIGDSHAAHLFYGFINSKNKNYRHAIVLGSGACPPSIGMETREGCMSQLDSALQWVNKNKHITLVVLSAYYDYVSREEGEKQLLDGYKKTIDSITNHGKKVAFVIDTPSVPDSIKKCLSVRPRKINTIDTPGLCTFPLSEFSAQRTKYFRFIEQLQSQNPGVHFFDPTSLFCNEDSCATVYGSRLQYSDNNHLSIYGSQRVVEGLIKSMGEPYLPVD